MVIPILKDWYFETIDYWIRLLDGHKDDEGGIPTDLQIMVLEQVHSIICENLNNQNKHLFEEGEGEELLWRLGDVLARLDDNILLDPETYHFNHKEKMSFRWLWMILKYRDTGLQFDFVKGMYTPPEEGAKPSPAFFLSYNGCRSEVLWKQTADVQFMDVVCGKLVIEGRLAPVLLMNDSRFGIRVGDVFYVPEYTERYAHTKAFGVTLFKRYAFRFEIPLTGRTQDLRFVTRGSWGESGVTVQFDSHFSRATKHYPHSYWHMTKKLVMYPGPTNLLIRKKKRLWVRELKLWRDMMRDPKRRAIKYIPVRFYLITKKIWKRRPIWFFMDKIYKGGDSSEYMYRYAMQQKDGIKKYYLIDKDCPDYDRLKADGFEPLVRKSLKHRMMFLAADMVIATNSTVYAFNDMNMEATSYIRDRMNFHTVCLQHGLSVQKIAVAQNRLRDNTRLYFCASKYEIENLSKPVYGYENTNALKLTGIPRYDGLENRDKKQIMISPTWRMQAAVKVTQNEGVARDYNPLFKESDYYRVYNSLINDPRLIEAAKAYGYRIVYVLHPIVSSQVDDFDKNDYVDIIPAIGDMSYEKLFCESSLLVTDYSGIQFDFAYMRKPLVYLHHKDIPQHYEEGTYHYDTMAFGEICHDNDELIDLLCEYMADGCRMKPEYVARADDFFEFNDRNNCKRVYDVMLDYQRNVISAKKKDVYLDVPGISKEELSRREKSRRRRMEKEEDRMIESGTSKYNERFRVDLDEVADVSGEYEEILKEHGEKAGAKTINDCYFQEEIRGKTILLLGLARSVRGNMKYILDELNSSDAFEGFRLIVRTEVETDAIVRNYIVENRWNRTETVLDNMLYAEVLESAKYLITETFFPETWVKKPGQVCINIWHGTPIKKVGLAKKFKNAHKNGNAQKNFINADYLLYPNELTRDRILESYGIAELTGARQLLLGYPRTGGILSVSPDGVGEIRKKLAPGGEKIYVYMPTFRDYFSMEESVQQAKDFLDVMDSGLSDNQILYVNLHHQVSDSLDYSCYERILKFPSDIDSYRIMAASDAMISDYSSVFFDYLVTRKQIILYIPDYEMYEKRRGMYTDVRTFPFDKAETPEEVLEALNRGKTYDDSELYVQMCSCDSAENSKKLCQLFLGDEEGLELGPIPQKGLPKVILHSDLMENGEATTLLQKFAQSYHKEDYNFYFSVDSYRLNEKRCGAYPMLWRVPVIGSQNDPHLSSVGNGVRDLYQKGEISFDEAMGYLKYDYALMHCRMWGDAEFDLVVIYDSDDPERIIGLAETGAVTFLFVQTSMLDQIDGGNVFMRDALRYAAKYSNRIFTLAESTRERAVGLLGEELKDRIGVIDPKDGASELNKYFIRYLQLK